MTIAIIQDIENIPAEVKAWFETSPTVQTVESDAVILEQWLLTNAYPLVKQDALTVITAAITGTPWATLVANLISTAESQGKTLEAGVAQVALNLAQSQLIMNGTQAPVTPVPASSGSGTAA